MPSARTARATARSSASCSPIWAAGLWPSRWSSARAQRRVCPTPGDHQLAQPHTSSIWLTVRWALQASACPLFITIAPKIARRRRWPAAARGCGRGAGVGFQPASCGPPLGPLALHRPVEERVTSVSTMDATRPAFEEALLKKQVREHLVVRPRRLKRTSWVAGDDLMGSSCSGWRAPRRAQLGGRLRARAGEALLVDGQPPGVGEGQGGQGRHSYSTTTRSSTRSTRARAIMGTPSEARFSRPGS